MSFHHEPLQIVKKVWGMEEWLVNDTYCAKKMTVVPGFQCSLHFHQKKTETFHILEGSLRLTVGGSTEMLTPGMTVTIFPGQLHRFSSMSRERSCVFLEISNHHDDADVTRLEESCPLSS